MSVSIECTPAALLRGRNAHPVQLYLKPGSDRSGLSSSEWVTKHTLIPSWDDERLGPVVAMVDAPVTCKLLSHSLSCHPPTVNKKKRISEAGPKWVDDKTVEFCQSCGFQFNFLIRRHHCRHCGNLFCRYCAQDRWPLPKFEYLHPVRVCRKCSRLCWKAEALLQAINNNDINSLVKYVQRKNDCNLHTGIYPPLTVAAAAGFSEVCHVLIKGGANVNHAIPAFQKTTIVTCSFCHHADAHMTARSNQYECQRCHEVTFTVDDNDKEAAYRGLACSDHIGMTALHATIKGMSQHVDVVKHLLQAGANQDARTHNGNTPLMLAAACGHADVCKILLRSKADANAVCDFDGDTPLHRAVREGHAKIVSLLIDAGARATHKNLEGLTAVQLAEKKKKSDVIEALQARPSPQPPSRGPDFSISPNPDSEDGDRERSARGGGYVSEGPKGTHRGGGDALEEDLEIAARKALALVDDD